MSSDVTGRATLAISLLVLVGKSYGLARSDTPVSSSATRSPSPGFQIVIENKHPGGIGMPARTSRSSNILGSIRLIREDPSGLFDVLTP